MAYDSVLLNPASTFIGHLDVGMGYANVESVAEDIDNELKWAALWNEELLLYDGYIHAYAPMAAACIASRRSTRLPATNALRATISAFLENGILCPVSRGDSILTVWWNEENHVTPGEYLCLPKEPECIQYMEWVEKKSVTQKRNVSLPSLGKGFREMFMSCISTTLRTHIQEDIGPLNDNRRHITEAMKVLDDIQNALEGISTGAFRRGEVERVMGSHLGLTRTFPDIYSEVWKRKPDSLASSDIDNYVLFQVSRWQSAMFQVLLGKRLNGVSGLDPAHPDELAYSYFFHDLFDLPRPGEYDLMLPGQSEYAQFSIDQYDVMNALTASDVLDFRTGDKTRDTFDHYVNLRRLATNDESKVKLVAHVYHEFLPKLHEFARQRGLCHEEEDYQRLLEARLARGTLALLVFGRPFLTFILPLASSILEGVLSIGLKPKWEVKHFHWDAFVKRRCPPRCNYYIPSIDPNTPPIEDP